MYVTLIRIMSLFLTFRFIPPTRILICCIQTVRAVVAGAVCLEMHTESSRANNVRKTYSMTLSKERKLSGQALDYNHYVFCIIDALFRLMQH